jgi:hypothetical protein
MVTADDDNNKSPGEQPQQEEPQNSENLPERVTFDLSPEQAEAWREAERKQQEQGRKVDRTIAIASNLIAPRWAAKKARAKKKPKKPLGRPRDYDYQGITKLTEGYIRDHGCPQTAALLREKVEDVCRDHKPRSIVVPPDTTFKKIVNPIWRRHHGKSQKVRK